MSNERDFAAHAENAIATQGVFSTTFSHLDWLWRGQNLDANEKAERIVQFAFSHGWRAIPGIGETEVLFERRTLSGASPAAAGSSVSPPSRRTATLKRFEGTRFAGKAPAKIV